MFSVFLDSDWLLLSTGSDSVSGNNEVKPSGAFPKCFFTVGWITGGWFEVGLDWKVENTRKEWLLLMEALENIYIWTYCSSHLHRKDILIKIEHFYGAKLPLEYTLQQGCLEFKSPAHVMEWEKQLWNLSEIKFTFYRLFEARHSYQKLFSDRCGFKPIILSWVKDKDSHFMFIVFYYNEIYIVSELLW